MSMKSHHMYLFKATISRFGTERTTTTRAYAVQAASFGMAYRRCMQYAMQPWVREHYWQAHPAKVEIEFQSMVTVDA